MNSRVVFAALWGITVSLISPLCAHPGHGATDPAGLAHYTTEWIHAGPWWIAVAALAAAALLRRIIARRVSEG